MQKVKKIVVLVIALSLFISSKVSSQSQASSNGIFLPPRGTVHVLIVFAELVGPCAGTGSINWPTGPAAPPNADLYLDHVVSANAVSKLTQYYKDISLGEFNVVGDYYDGTLQVPCSLATALGSDYRAAIAQLNSVWQPVGGNYLTKKGLNLNDFDNYQSLSNGLLKSPGNPDGNIDCTVILWRNNYNNNMSCGSGYGVGNFLATNSAPLKSKNVYLFGSWDFCPDNLNNGGYDSFFTIEFFHSIVGGNNFHCDGGFADRTFMYDGTGSYTTCQGGASNIVCGWDRNFLGWKGSRQHLISAVNISGVETPSDLTITNTPNTTEFILMIL